MDYPSILLQAIYYAKFSYIICTKEINTSKDLKFPQNSLSIQVLRTKMVKIHTDMKSKALVSFFVLLIAVEPWL